MKLTGKLMVMVVVPVVVAFAALALVSTGGQVVGAESLRSLVVAGSAAGEWSVPSPRHCAAQDRRGGV